MLDLEVVPETSLGCDKWEFILGMHFSQAVAIVHTQIGVIKGVQVLYSDSNPLGVDLVINLPCDGIRLIFDPVVQRLKAIEVFNMKLVKLKYSDVHFNSPEVVPSIEQIEHSFGATHPGVYDAAKQLFALHFRGLSFYFPVDSKLHPGYAHGLGSLIFPSGASPAVSKMALYSGSTMAESRSPPLPLCCYNRQLYVESATVLRTAKFTTGLKLQLFTEEAARTLEPRKHCFTKDILFGDTCEDVTTHLGAPNKMYFKSEDKMKIHAPNIHRRVQNKRSDLFLNYSTLGIDLLFDARTQRCKKIVLHTNYPGHYNFNMYHRCEFQFQLTSDIGISDNEPFGSPVIISAHSRWDTISPRLAVSERPVVLHRASSTNTANPFGSTFCYGYQDIIFEVMPNKYIASVTLYNCLNSKPGSEISNTTGLQDVILNPSYRGCDCGMKKSI